MHAYAAHKPGDDWFLNTCSGIDKHLVSIQCASNFLFIFNKCCNKDSIKEHIVFHSQW